MSNNEIAVKLLQFIAKRLDENMDWAKTHKDDRSINIAGFCAQLKREIGIEKARIIGTL